MENISSRITLWKNVMEQKHLSIEKVEITPISSKRHLAIEVEELSNLCERLLNVEKWGNNCIQTSVRLQQTIIASLGILASKLAHGPFSEEQKNKANDLSLQIRSLPFFSISPTPNPSPVIHQGNTTSTTARVTPPPAQPILQPGASSASSSSATTSLSSRLEILASKLENEPFPEEQKKQANDLARQIRSFNVSSIKTPQENEAICSVLRGLLDPNPFIRITLQEAFNQVNQIFK
jgi:hypothetical protein